MCRIDVDEMLELVNRSNYDNGSSRVAPFHYYYVMGRLSGVPLGWAPVYIILNVGDVFTKTNISPLNIILT